jgi:uncharacterized protein YjbI with pentapeptide repeats
VEGVRGFLSLDPGGGGGSVAEEFTCEVEKEEYRSACKDLPKYPGTRYCVLHYPGAEKDKEDFLKVVKSKLDRNYYDFGGTVFPEGTSDFEGREFNANTNFDGATFLGPAIFARARFKGDTSFSGTNFSGKRTDFNWAQFSGEDTFFQSAQFSSKETDFFEAQFFSSDLTDFSGAQFGGEGTSFLYAQFKSEMTLFVEAQFSSEMTGISACHFSGKDTSFLYAQFRGKKTDCSHTKFFSSETTDFLGVQFSGEDTSFHRAQFSSKETDFSKTHSEAQFSGKWTSFFEAQFSGRDTNFGGAKFGSRERTNFQGAEFSGEWTDFQGAEFGSAETNFQETTFVKEANFTEATFKEKASFMGTAANLVFGSQAQAWFDHSRIDKPEQVTFHTVLLHPGWFVNADVRKVNLTDVKWYGMPGGPKGTLDEEINALEARDVEASHTLLAQACRRLSANAEENREYPLANEFHYWAMDTVRKGSWVQFKGLTLRGLLKKEAWQDIGEHFGLITTLYWALSGYGVRAARAFWALVVIWAAFATLYVLVNPSEFKDFGQGIGYLWQTAVYSLLALARLNPEPRPDEPGLFQFLVGLEGILGPLQIALLALAVRRRVMR